MKPEPKIEVKPRLVAPIESTAPMREAVMLYQQDAGWTLERLWLQGDRVARREVLLVNCIKPIVLGRASNLLEDIE